MLRIELRNESYKKNIGKLMKPEERVILKIKKQQQNYKNYENCEKKVKSVQMGSWKALNETAKIMRIAKLRKAVDENRWRNANGSWKALNKTAKITKIAKFTKIAKL